MLAIFSTNKICYKKHIWFLGSSIPKKTNELFYCFQEKMRFQFEQNGSYFSHLEPSVSTDLVQNGQQTADTHQEQSVDTDTVQNRQQIADTDMPEQHESSEAITVDNHVARDIPSERSMEDGTIVDGSAGVENGSIAP